MKTTQIFRLFLLPGLLLILFATAQAQTGFDRQAYYQAFAANKTAAIDGQIKKTAALTGSDRDAFEGALLMRKAGIVSNPAEKLSLFRQGGKKLEGAIKAHPNNIEYRFLRLMIQENAPKIVGYADNLKEDSSLVKQQLKKLDAATQQAVSQYSKQSKYL